MYPKIEVYTNANRKRVQFNCALKNINCVLKRIKESRFEHNFIHSMQSKILSCKNLKFAIKLIVCALTL